MPIGVAALVETLTRSGLEFHLSSPLHRRVQDQQPQVVEVYFEPDSTRLLTGALSAPQPILVVHGTVKLAPEQLTWVSSDSPDTLRALFGRASGRLQIRLHASHLFDAAERPFSSAVDALTGVKSPHVPGGTWESWMFTTTT
jgi:hypothetical protein